PQNGERDLQARELIGPGEDPEGKPLTITVIITVPIGTMNRLTVLHHRAFSYRRCVSVNIRGCGGTTTPGSPPVASGSGRRSFGGRGRKAARSHTVIQSAR